jgi:hypothetical protein
MSGGIDTATEAKAIVDAALAALMDAIATLFEAYPAVKWTGAEVAEILRGNARKAA